MAHLECHLSLWSTGDISSLLKESQTIQACLPQVITQHITTSNWLARKFSDLMFMGNVAIRLLPDSTCWGGSLPLDSVINGKSVKDILLEKHPTA